MKRHKHRKKNKGQVSLTKEELVYQTVEELASDMGISFSEALGFTLGIENPTYGWEDELSPEELDELINSSGDYIPEDDEGQENLF